MEAFRESGGKAAKRRKGGKAGRGTFTLKLPKFEDATAQAEFMMYTFKVAVCTRRRRHTWSGCPYAHPGETARRRDPRTHCAVPCPEMKQGQQCPRGDRCPYSHHDFEYWLHPTRYRTVCCNKTGDCGRALCFFYHGPEEQRTTSSQNGMGDDCMSVLPKDQMGNKVHAECEHESPKIPLSTCEEGIVSEEDEGSSSDTRMASCTASHVCEKSGSCSASSHSTSSTQQISSELGSNQFTGDSMSQIHMPATENLASRQIQNLLANAVKAQGTPRSSSILSPQGRCPSTHSHGSGSPTSTYASYLGASTPDDVMDMGGGNVGWGNMAAGTIDLSQMNDFIARRQSAPTVMGMCYQEALQLFQSAKQETAGDPIQGLLVARGSTHPSWAPTSMAHTPPNNQRAPPDIQQIHSQNVCSNVMGGRCYEQNGLPVAQAAYMDSPFLLGSNMANAALLGARWELLGGASGGDMSACNPWGAINSSHSMGIAQTRGYPQGSFQNSTSCTLMGVLGMETN